MCHGLFVPQHICLPHVLVGHSGQGGHGVNSRHGGHGEQDLEIMNNEQMLTDFSRIRQS